MVCWHLKCSSQHSVGLLLLNSALTVKPLFQDKNILLDTHTEIRCTIYSTSPCWLGQRVPVPRLWSKHPLYVWPPPANISWSFVVFLEPGERCAPLDRLQQSYGISQNQNKVWDCTWVKNVKMYRAFVGQESRKFAYDTYLPCSYMFSCFEIDLHEPAQVHTTQQEGWKQFF